MRPSECPAWIDTLLEAFEVTDKTQLALGEGWMSYLLIRDGLPKLPIILIMHGPKNVSEIVSTTSGYASAVILYAERRQLLLRTPDRERSVTIDNDTDVEVVAEIIKKSGIAKADGEIRFGVATRYIIDTVPSATTDFINHGIFSTHYLKARLLDDARRDRDVDKLAETLNQLVAHSATGIDLVGALGWNVDKKDILRKKNVTVIFSRQTNFDTSTDGWKRPTVVAVSELKSNEWVVLTNGTTWRLYAGKALSPSSNWFEVTLDTKAPRRATYVAAIFGTGAYEGDDPPIDLFFRQGKTFAAELEKDLAKKVLQPRGIFLDLVQGWLGHSSDQKYTSDQLAAAKNAATKIMYRVWFVLYAESMDLLPREDDRYKKISLTDMRTRLSSLERNDSGTECWDDLVRLFGIIRDGSPEHGVPQYNGGLFGFDAQVDQATIDNQFIVPALRGLFERDGDAIDYGTLGVRHLGNIYEALLESRVLQASKQMILVEKSGKTVEIDAPIKTSETYNKNDLYLMQKGGIASRKSGGVYYTPEEIVNFLVRRGLEPIFEGRESRLTTAIKKWQSKKSDSDKKECTDLLLDIRVLDPAMGSGHFLVEAMNQITVWITSMLERYPDHPLLEDLEQDRKAVVRSQHRRGISVDIGKLTLDTLLKRRVMKRCIFGVDIKPMAVELAKLSLWLDSFAIGMPLTFLDHHLRPGDSTIGLFLDDIPHREDVPLDDFLPGAAANHHMLGVSNASDTTVDEVHKSEEAYAKCRDETDAVRRILDAMTAFQMNRDIIPAVGTKKRKVGHNNNAGLFHKFASPTRDEAHNLKNARLNVKKYGHEYSFFHWDSEMIDAFADARRGFDLIVGNPPWEKIKPSDDEFFEQYDPTFRSLPTAPHKKKRREEILTNKTIMLDYKKYHQKIKERAAFYKTYKMQGRGDTDLWMLMLERTTLLLTRGGIISMVIPAQILSNNGATDMRRYVLDRDIRQIYVFENKQKIFPIHRQFRFALLTLRDSHGSDSFDTAFYVRNTLSLTGRDKSEQKKFTHSSKKLIRLVSPSDFLVPEVRYSLLQLLAKLHGPRLLRGDMGGGWSLKRTSGLNMGTDADLFRKDRHGWPLLMGRNIHQYSHAFDMPDYAVEPASGLERLGQKGVYMDSCKKYHDEYMLLFRNTAAPTNVRSIIASIVPPHTFHADSINSFVVYRSHDKVATGREYHEKIAYLAGIMNSLTFDFIARSKLQLNVKTIIDSMPLPPISGRDFQISKLATALTVDATTIKRRSKTSSPFDPFASSLKTDVRCLTPAEKIDITAQLDAMVAHAYGLTGREYKTILNTFDFTDNYSIRGDGDLNWTDYNVLRRFYGDVRQSALEFYDKITTGAVCDE